MRPLLAALLFAVAAPAFAADHELSFEVGSMFAPETGFDTFSDGGALVSFGGRGAFALNDHFSVQAAYSHGRKGTTLQYYDETGPLYAVSPVAAFFANEIAIGPRFDWKLWNFFVPYARVDGLFLIADARFDDDPNDADSPGQLKEMGFSGGVRPMAGIDFIIPRKDGGLSAGFYVEGGYSWLSPTKFETFGDVHLYGFTLRSGIGFRL